MIITNKDELMESLEKKPEVPQDKKELVRTCVPYNPISLMLNDLRTRYAD